MSFPEDFVWGSATSSYQIEGSHDALGRGPSVWDEFCRVPGRVRGGDTGDIAADHVNRYKDDVALMKSIGLQAYRFSISWSRVLPEGFGSVSEAGLGFYDRLVDELLGAGITPWATLFHWDLPAGVQRRGGWLNPETVDWFEAYTKVVVTKLSDRVSHWFTFNEPQVFVGMGYAKGEHAPGLELPMTDLIRISHHVHLAHGRSARTIREHAQTAPKIGWAPVCKVGVPVDTQTDTDAAHALMSESALDPMWSNTWWSDPVFLGTYPEDGLSRFGTMLPDGWERNLGLIQQPLDFCGANIYLGDRVQATKSESNTHGFRVLPPKPGTPRSGFGWEITPEVLYWGPTFLWQRYGTPVVITENGMANPDWVDVQGKVQDPQRIDFLARHLVQLKKAIDHGTSVQGYFLWSLLDNFEWADGYHQRFGLIHVDFETQKRTPKASAGFYTTVIDSHGAVLAEPN